MVRGTNQSAGACIAYIEPERYSPAVAWLQKYRWPILAALIALAIPVKLAHRSEFFYALLFIVLLGTALFAPAPRSLGR